MIDRRRFARIAAVLLLFALMNGMRMIGRPGLEQVRAVDIVQILGTGMCLGAAIMAGAVAWGRPRSA